MLNDLPTKQILTIQEAADILKVSTKTLRRWEAQGILVAERTPGNQRRYSKVQIESFSAPKRQPSTVVTTSVITPPILKSLPEVSYSKKFGFSSRHYITLATIAVIIGSFIISRNLELTSKTSHLLSSSFNSASKLFPARITTKVFLPVLTQLQIPSKDQVLASETVAQDFVFNINVPTLFNSPATTSSTLDVIGNLTAPNVIYGLTPGPGIAISTGQNPTISLTNQQLGSNSFNKITIVGQPDLFATATTDTLTFVAGSNISLTTDTVNKKITISSTASSTSSNTSSGTNIDLPVAVTNGGTGLSVIAEGDMLYASAANIITRLPIGTAGQLLTVSGGIPAWQTSAITCIGACLGSAPTSTQTIIPALSNVTGLSIAQAAAGSVDIFNVTNNNGSVKYLQIDSTGETTFNGQINVSGDLVGVGGPTITGFSSINGTVINGGTFSGGMFNGANITGGSMSGGTYTGTGLTAAGNYTVTIGNSNNFYISDGTNTLLTLNDSGSTGTLTVANINISSLTPSKTLFTDASRNLTSTGTVSEIQGGTGQSTYATGDILYASAANTLNRLSVGSPGQVLSVSGGNIPSWISSGALNYWQRANGVVAPVNITDDFVVGGTATSSALFQVFADTGSASSSGSITSSTLRPPTGLLSLQYKNGANTWTNGLVIQPTSGFVGIGTDNPVDLLQVAGPIYLSNTTPGTTTNRIYSNNSSDLYWGASKICVEGGPCASTGTLGYSGTPVSGQIAYFDSGTSVAGNNQYFWDNSKGNLGVGTNMPDNKVSVIGNAAGNALVAFNEIGSNDIFTASAGGATKFTIANNGNLVTNIASGVVFSNSGTLTSESQLAISRGGTNGNASPTNGGIAYGTGTAYAFSLAGISGQILQSNGAASPIWVDSSTVGTNYWTKDSAGILSPTLSEPLAATSGATTVATFTTNGSNYALKAGSSTNFVTVDNSGNIGTSSLTASLFNDTATTINIGASGSFARTINIGNEATSVNTINMGSSNAGNITIQSGAVLTLSGSSNSIISFPNFDVAATGKISVAAGQGLDTSSSGILGIGTSTANAISIGSSGIVTTIDSGLTLTTGRNLIVNGDTLTDLTGNGLTTSSNALTIATNEVSSVASGLNVSASGISLLRTCGDNQILKWTGAAGWACAADSSGGVLNYWNNLSGVLSPNITDGSVIAATSSATTVATFTASGTNDALRVGGSATYTTIDASGNLTARSQAQVRLGDSDNTQYTGFQAPANVTSNSVYTLPAAFPGSSGFIKSDASGVMSFDTATYDNYASWTLAGDSGTGAITSGTTGTVAGGTNLTSAVSGTTVTVNLDNDISLSGTTGLTLTGAGSHITFQNGEQILNTTDGTLSLSAATNLYVTGGISTYDTAVTSGYVEASGLCLGNGTNCITSWAGAGVNYWTQANNTLYPNNYWSEDLLIGGNSTASATFAVNATNGNVKGGTYNGLTISNTTGTLTLTNAKTLSVQNSLTFAGTDSTTMTFPGSSTTVAGLGINQTFTGTNSFSALSSLNGGQLNSGAVTGKAFAIFNETGDQAILTASSGGVTRFTVANNGVLSAGTGNVALTNTTGNILPDALVDCADTQILKWTTVGGWACAADAGSGSGSSKWTEQNSLLYPNNGASLSVAVGTVTESQMHGLFTVSGTKTGKALTVLNDTGTDQNILTASASGNTVMNLDRTGNLSLLSQGDLRLGDSDNTQYTGFQAPANVTSNSVYTLPAAFPGSSGFIKSDASGVMSFDTATYDNYASWTLAGDSGTGAITSGTTGTVAGGTNLTSAVSGTTVTVNLDNDISLSGTTGLTLTGAGSHITFQNGEQILNTTDGTLSLSAATNLYVTGGISTYDTAVTSGYVEASGLCLGNGTNCITSWAGAGVNYWTQANNTLYPNNYWSEDLLIGGNSTASATFAVNATNGNVKGGTYNGLTISNTTGTLTLTNAKTLSVQNSLTFAGTDSTTMTFPGSSTTVAGLGINQTFTGTNSFSALSSLNGGQLNSGAVTGKAFAIFNETGDQAILTASSGGVTRFTVANNGVLSAGTGNVALTNTTGNILPDALVDCADTQILKWTTVGGWACAADAGSGSGSSKWTEQNSLLYPNNGASLSVAVGTVTESQMHGLFTVSGTKTGKALTVLNDTGTDQNILTASASGNTVMNLDRTGNLSLLSQGDLRLGDSDNTQYTGFQAPANVTSNSVYTLPAAFPGSSGFIKSDASGVMSFDTATYDNYASWTLAGDSGTGAITSGTTGTVAGGTNLTSAVSGTTVTVNLDNDISLSGTTGLTLTGAGSHITFQNGEQILNTTDGTLSLSAATNLYVTGGISTYDTAVTSGYVEASGLCLGNGTNCITSWAGAGVNYWTQANNTLYPNNYWSEDLIIGGNATASAKFQAFAATGDASMSGTLTSNTLRPSTGNLSLGYKSGANTWGTAMTIQPTTGYIGVGTINPSSLFEVSGANPIANINAVTGNAALKLSHKSATAWDTWLTNDGLGLGFWDGSSDLMRILSNGDVGIGTSAPSGKLSVYDVNNVISGNSTNFQLNFLSYVSKIINSGITDSGAMIGSDVIAMRNWGNAGDSGTLDTVYGSNTTYGNANTDAGATPITNNAYGLYIRPFAQTGTIGNMYDIYLTNEFTGGSVTNKWGIYQQNTKNNYFGGNIGIGATTPTSKLTTSGASTGKALAVFNETGNQAILTASSAGVTRFTIAGNGDIQTSLTSGAVYNTNGLLLSAAQLPVTYGGTNGNATPTSGALAYGTGTAYAFTLAGTSGQVLQSNGAGSPTWIDASGVGTNFWQRALGAVAPVVITDDLLIGGNATSSAKFQVFGNTGNATSSGNLTFTSGATISTTSKQTLNIGNSTTGNILITPQEKLELAGILQLNSVALPSTTTNKLYNNAGSLYWGTDTVCTSGSGCASVGTVLTSGTPAAGQITYFQDPTHITGNDNFFWDITNFKLGIGTNGPANRLSVDGAITGKALVGLNQTGDQSIFTASSSGTPRFTIANNGDITTSLATGAIYSNSGLLTSEAQLAVTRGGTNSTATPSNGQVAYGNGTQYQFTSSGSTGNVLSFNSGSAPTWISASGLGTNYWNKNSGVLFPNDVDGSVIAATSAATTVASFTSTGTNFAFRAGGATGHTSINSSGNIILSGSNAYTGIISLATLTGDQTYTFPDAYSGTVCLSSGNCAGGSGGSKWQVNGTVLAPLTATNQVVLGGNIATNNLFELNGKRTGYALASFNETGDQAIFTASSAGTPRFTIANNGNIITNLSTGALYSNSGTLTSEAQLAITRGGTNGTSSPASGQVAYGDGSKYMFTSGGSDGYVLSYNTSSAPTWISASGVGTNYWNKGFGVLTPNGVDGSVIAATSSATTVATFTAGGTATALRVGGATNYSLFDVNGNHTVTAGYGVDTIAAGELKLGDTTATTVSLGTTAGATFNIGAGGALARAINIGTGTGIDTINMGTGGTGADVINIGSANAGNVTVRSNATLTLAGGATSIIDFTNFDVATTGNVTVAAGQGIDTNASGILNVGNTTASTVNVGNTAATTLAIGAGGNLTRTINIGTGTGADTINIGTGNTAADAISIGGLATSTIKVLGVTSLGDGGVTNYTQFNATGDISLAGSAALINKVSGTLNLNTTNNQPITTGTGLLTAGGNLTVSGNLITFGNNETISNGTDGVLALSGTANAVVVRLPTATAASEAGLNSVSGNMYYDSTNNKFRCRTASAWVDCDTSGGLANFWTANSGVLSPDGINGSVIAATSSATTVATFTAGGTATALRVGGATNYSLFDVNGNHTVTAGYGVDTIAAGELKLGDTTATTVSLGTTAGATFNIGAGGALARAINIGTGTGIDTINMGTGGTGADVINIGSANAGNVTVRSNATLTLAGGATSIIDFTNFDVATTGNVTVAAGQGIDTNASGILNVGNTTASTVNVGNTAATTLAIGAGGNLTRTINIGTGTGADTINIGTGNTAADAISIGGLATSTIKVLGVTSLGDGGVTNYTQFNATGDISLAGSAALINKVSGTLNLNTTNNQPITTGTGLLTAGGNLTVSGNLITFGNNETISNGTDGVLALSGTANAVVVRLPTATAASEAGLNSVSGNMYYDSTNNKFRCRTASAWVDCDTSGGLANFWTANSGVLSPDGINGSVIAATSSATTVATFTAGGTATALRVGGATNYSLFDVNGNHTVTAGYGVDTIAAGELKLGDTTATTVSLGTTAGATFNIGAGGALARAINIGTGTGIDTINMGTGGTGADVINIGSANAGNVTVRSNATLTLAGGATSIIDFTNFDVATTGNVTVAAGQGIDTNASGILNVGNTTASTVNVGNTAATTLAIGAGGNLTRTINIGTGTGADTINIGTGNTAADAISIGGLATSTIKVLGVTSLGDGGVTNYTQFNATGDISLAGSAALINKVSGTLNLNTTNNQPITTGTGLLTAGGNLTVSGNLITFGNNETISNGTDGVLALSGTANAVVVRLPTATAASEAGLNSVSGNMYYDSTNNKFRCRTASAWVDCDTSGGLANFWTANSGVLSPDGINGSVIAATSSATTVATFTAGGTATALRVGGATNYSLFDVNGNHTVTAGYGVDTIAAGELKLGDTTATTVSLGTTAGATFNIGAGGALARAINIGTGTGIDTINMGTGGTGADVINIGSANAGNVTVRSNATLTLAGGATSIIDFTNFDVATTGNVTVAAGQGIDTNASGILNVGNTTASTVNVGNTAATTLAIGAGGNLTRTINIGTGTGADTINIGTGNTAADAISIGGLATSTIKVLGVTSLGDGGVTNYTQFNATGDISLAGSAALINKVSGTLNLNTTNNQPITTGTGLLTAGGNLTVSGNLITFGNNETISNGTDGVLALSGTANAVVVRLPTATAASEAGLNSVSGNMYYDSTNNKFRCRTASAWVDCDTSGGLANFWTANSGVLSPDGINGSVIAATSSATTVATFTAGGTATALRVGGATNYSLFDVNGNHTVTAGYGVDTIAAGELKLGDTTATTVSLGTTAGATFNIGAGGALARAINIGTGTGIDTINMGTGGTGADVINIGSANAGNVTVRSNATLTLAGGATSIIDFTNFDVATTGNVTVAAGQGIDTNASGILNVGNTTASTVNVGNTAATTLAIGAGGNLTRTINIGTGTGADTINIGTGNTAADAISIGGLATSTIKVLGVTSLGDGGVTNYTQFNATGDISLAGSAALINKVSGTLNLNTTNNQPITTGTGLLTAGGNLTVSGNLITFGNNETISNGTDGVLALSGTANAVVVRLPTATAASEAGLNSVSGNMYYDSTNNKFRCRTASAWVDCDTSGGLANFWTANSGVLSPDGINGSVIAATSSATTVATFTAGGTATALRVGGATNYSLFDVNGNHTVTAGYGVDTIAAGELKLGDTTATTVSLGTTAGATFNIGAGGALARAINIGTGTGIDTINMGTGGTGADVINIGSANAGNVTVRSNATLTLAGGATSIIDFTNFDVATTGNVTVAAGQGIDTNASGILNVGNTTASTVNVGNTAATTLAIGAGGNLTRTINIGTGTGADTINIGTGNTAADAISIGGLATSTIKVLGVTSLGDGGVTNYTQFNATGDISLAGSAALINKVSGTLNLNTTNNQPITTGTGLLTAGGNLTVSGNLITFGNNETISNGTDGVLALSGTANAVVVRLPTATAASEAGLNSVSGNMYYDSTNNKFRCRTASAWVDCDTSGGLANFWTANSGVLSPDGINGSVIAATSSATTVATFTAGGTATALRVGGATNYSLFDVNGNHTVTAGYGVDTIAAGELKLGDTTATTVSLGTTAGATFNIGAGGALARAINIGTGTGIDTINMGTGGTGADVINIGSANAGNVTVRSNATLTLAGGATSIIDFTNFDVATTGNVTVAAGQGIDTNASGILNVGNTTASTVNVGNTAATTLAIGAGGNLTRTINIGTGTGADTINIGTGATGADQISLGGTGANIISLGNTQTGGSISLGAVMTTGSLVLGGSQTTGTTTIGGTGMGTVNGSNLLLPGGYLASGKVTGKAFAVLNEQGDQNILTASASGATKFVVARDGSIQLWDNDSSNYIALQSPALTANLTYTLPATIGGNNWILQTTSGGAMSWLDPGTLPSSNYWSKNSGVLNPNGTDGSVLAATSSATTVATFTASGSNTALRAGGSTAYTTIDQNGNISSSGTTGLNLTGAASGITFSDVSTHTISASSGTLAIGTYTLTGSVTGSGTPSMSSMGTYNGTTLGPGGTVSGGTLSGGTVSGGSLASGSYSNTGLSVTGAYQMTLSSGGGNNDFSIYDGTNTLMYLTDAGTYGKLGLGVASAPDNMLTASGAVAGKALVGLNYTGTDQNILTASASGTTVMNLSRTGDITMSSGTTNSDSLKLSPNATGSNSFVGNLTIADLTAARTWTLPDSSGTLGLASSDYWQRSLGAVAPSVVADDLLIGGSATASALFRVAGITPTTGNALALNANSLTTGNAFNLTSSSTALTTGRLLSMDWDPATPATASGDLFRLNIGQAGDVTGNLFNITSSGSSLFSVSETAITANLPTTFTAAGDVTMAYDLILSNQTSSNIKTKAPFILDIGDNYESNNLTLQTYNSGKILLNVGAGTGGVGIGNAISPNGLFDVNGAKTGQALVQLNENGDQAIFTASQAGATKFVIDNTGRVGIGTSNPLNTLDVVGRMRLSSTTTNAASKYSYILTPHYTNASTEMGALFAGSEAGRNFVGIGGGTASYNSANEILFYTGATTTTLTGTERMHIDSAGNVGIGTSVPASLLNVSGATTGKALVTLNESGNQNILAASASGLTVATLSRTGDLTLGRASGLTGSLVLANANNAYSTTIKTSDTQSAAVTYTLPTTAGTNTYLLSTNGSGVLSWTDPGSLPASNFWVRSATTLSPVNYWAEDLLIGGNATASALFRVSGSTNTTGNSMALTANNLTTGNGLKISSTSTSLTSGLLANLDWAPSSPATASGDLFRLNIGAAGDITGNLFNITSANSSLFSVSETAVTSNLPTSFNAAGDVSVAYDLKFTNQTSSYIDSNAPLYIRAGESFESNNLTLQTYNSGNIILDPTGTGSVAVGTGSAALKFFVSDNKTATASAMIENINPSTTAGGLAIKLGFTGIGSTNNNFVTFLNGMGKIQGKINATADNAVAYTTRGIDFAEYFAKDGGTYTPGEVITLGDSGATRANTPYDKKLLGIVSTSPGFVGGIEGEDKVLVAIAGQVPVKIDPSSPAISIGDYLTSSSVPGLATKATKPGYAIGKALNSWNPTTPTSTIIVYTSTGWVDPNTSMAFNSNGDLILSNSSTPVAQQLTSLSTEQLSMSSEIASVSAQLQALQVRETPATMAAALSELTVLGDATISGRLQVSGPTILSDTSVTGKLSIGLLEIDDMAASLSSLTGVITANGDLNVTGTLTAEKININTTNVLGASVGKAIISTGLTELSIDTTAVSTASSIFVTPDRPVAISASATDSGRFLISIPATISSDLKVNWWIIN